MRIHLNRFNTILMDTHSCEKIKRHIMQKLRKKYQMYIALKLFYNNFLTIKNVYWNGKCIALVTNATSRLAAQRPRLAIKQSGQL